VAPAVNLFVPRAQMASESLKKRLPNCAGSWRPNWPNIAALAVWLLSVGTLLTHAVRSRKVLPVPPPP
jgi:hypothetical protein